MKQRSISMMMMVMTVVVMLVGYSAGADIDWSNAGAGNSWGTAENWVGNVVPGSGDTANIGMTDPDQAVVDGNFVVDEVFVGRSADGQLDIVDGGELTVTTQIRAGRDDGDGWINQTGGRLVTIAAHGLRLGTDDQTGYYHLSGGEVDATAGGNTFIGGWSGGRGEFTISGGQLSADHFHVARLDAGAQNVSGVFTVEGTWANSQIAAETFSLGTEDAGGHGTLHFKFDDGGVTPIEVAGDVIFGEHEANLDVSFLDDPVFGTWDVMTWDGTLSGEGNLAFAPGVDTDIWSFEINSGNSGSLSITAIPEPSSLVLLGLAGLLLMKRRSV